jgi:hypothetical protein
VSTLDQIVERVRAAAGADFAFVLTRKGRLVTADAPAEMPEHGRTRLVEATRPLVGTTAIAEVTMPRQDLVPYGGAAPVDVYAAVAAEQAIVCVVLSTWADKIHVAPAIREGLSAMEALLYRRRPGPKLPTLENPGTPLEPPTKLPGPAAAAARTAPRMPAIKRAPAPPPSAPEISVGHASLGRESLVAIEEDAGIRRTGPDISIGQAPLGRETLVAIQEEARPPGRSPTRAWIDPAATTAAKREPVSPRATRPWVEPPDEDSTSEGPALSLELEETGPKRST